MSQEMFEKLAEAVIEGEPDDAKALAKEALEKGVGCKKSVRTQETSNLHHWKKNHRNLFVPAVLWYSLSLTNSTIR